MLSETDRKILSELQRDASVTSQELGALVNLSPSQANRKRQRLQAEGYITGCTARVDPARLGLHLQAFVQVTLGTHSRDIATSFEELAAARPEIVSAWTLTGSADYLLRVYCEDLGGLNRLIHEVLLCQEGVVRVHSQIVLNHTKRDAALPVPSS